MKTCGHIDVRTLVQHQSAQTVGFAEGRRRAFLQRQRLFREAERELSIAIAFPGSKAGELEACDRHVVCGFV